MHKFRAALVGLLCLAVISGCSTNTSPGNVVFTTQPTMQLSVGTINDSAGVLSAQSGGSGAAAVYLDAIATFRNQFGNSAFIHPGSADLTPHTGGGACNFTTGTNCNVGGQFGLGLFGYGQTQGTNGVPASATAWASPGSPTGYIWDLDVFDLPGLPAAATPVAYSIKDSVVVNGQTATYSAGATLVTKVPLPAAANPVSFVSNGPGTGGGTLTIGAIAAGATEQVAIIVGPGTPACPTCLPVPIAEVPAAPGEGVPFQGEVKGATVVIPVPNGTLKVPGPGQLGVPYLVFVVDADFGWVEAGLTTAPTVGTPTPNITNGLNGQADLTVSNFIAIHSP